MEGYRLPKAKIAEIIQQAPVAAYIISNSNFQQYSSGVFRCSATTTPSMINHAVEIVGFNLSGNYYIIKNSWGTRWGMAGFGYVDMDNDCLLSNNVLLLTGDVNTLNLNTDDSSSPVESSPKSGFQLQQALLMVVTVVALVMI